MLPKNFYPTPKHIIKEMTSKIQRSPKRILEPSAGKGDIIEYIQNESNYRRSFHYDDILAIEKDVNLQSILRGKRIKILDSDFLVYSGPDKFDLIIANPPFDEGDKHLLKAIDIMYRGEIIFLLNAETIRNPYTNTRKMLMKKLVELNADIEFIPNAFVLAERKTWVEIALIYINIERQVENDLFKDVNDKATPQGCDAKAAINHEVSNRRTIYEMVAEYNQIVNIGIETIIGYYKNYQKIGKYIGLNREAKDDYSGDDMTAKMQSEVNNLTKHVRRDFWRKTLDLKEVYRRMTSKRMEEFEYLLKDHLDLDFTESNIRQFVLNLIGGYKKSLGDAVLEIFETMTMKHCYGQLPEEKNVHYFDGWKTNKAFRCNRKVIIPIYGNYSFGGPFWSNYSNNWKLDYCAKQILSDIDTVMNYFDGLSYYNSLIKAIDQAFSMGKSRKIISTYFEITCYKKGTIHLIFRDKNILRRFNVAACMGKKWLPYDYCKKPFDDLSREEKQVAESFEGKESYIKNLGQPVFANHIERPMLGFKRKNHETITGSF